MSSSQTSTASEQGGFGGGDDGGLARAMMATGNLMGINTEKNVMKAFVQSELFPKVKFLQPEDLSATGIVSNMVRRHMNYKKHDWGGTGNVNSSVRSFTTSFVHTEFQESNGSAIKDEEALKKMVRDKGTAAPAMLYVHFLSNGLKCMVGATRWK
jgi:predicted GIY-YIG superfamily endonuclease